MEFKPYVWIHGLNTTYAVGTMKVVKLELIQGGRTWLGREDSLLRAMRTVEEKETNEPDVARS